MMQHRQREKQRLKITWKRLKFEMKCIQNGRPHRQRLRPYREKDRGNTDPRKKASIFALQEQMVETNACTKKNTIGRIIYV